MSTKIILGVFLSIKLWEGRALKSLYINSIILNGGCKDTMIHCKIWEGRALTSLDVNSIIPSGGCKDVMIHCKITSTVIVPVEKAHNKWTTSFFSENSTRQMLQKDARVAQTPVGSAWQNWKRFCPQVSCLTLPSNLLRRLGEEKYRSKTEFR